MCGKAQHVARTAQTRLYNSSITGRKFTKFLSDVEESSAALICIYMLRFPHPLWNASSQNEGGVCQYCGVIKLDIWEST